jgi:hypothetical protein
MNDSPEDRFDSDVAAGLRELGAADPLIVDRVRRSIGNLPDPARRPYARIVSVGMRSLVGLAGVIAVAATLSFWLAGSPARTPATGASLAQFANDPRMLACERAGGRTLADVQSALALDHGKDYRANLLIPVQPELASAEEPALLVVFTTGDSSTSAGGSPPLVFTPPPGSHTVCVGLTGVADPVVIRNLDAAAIVEVPAPAPSGPKAGVFADTKRPLAAMAWDESRQSLWVVTWNTGPNGQLNRVGLDGSTQSWPLPNGSDVQIQPEIQAGLQQPAMPTAWYGWDATDVVVDGQGDVWIAAGYGLVRFDPATGKSQVKSFAESDPTKVYVVDGGHWISAIAADGNGVLVARNGDASLVRVNEALGDAGTITLPSDWTGTKGLAVLGDLILAGGTGGLGVFDRTGARLAETGVAVQYRSLRPMGANRAVVLPTTIGETKATEVDDRGAAIGTIALPMEPIQANLAYKRLIVAANWTDYIWYGEWDAEQPVYFVKAALTVAP